VSIQSLVAVTVSVAVSCAGRKFTQFVSPDDEHMCSKHVES